MTAKIYSAKKVSSNCNTQDKNYPLDKKVSPKKYLNIQCKRS